MNAENINITKQGLWISKEFSEFTPPIADILAAVPTTPAAAAKIYKDDHVESSLFYEF